MPILAGVALAISPLIPKKPKVQKNLHLTAPRIKSPWSWTRKRLRLEIPILAGIALVISPLIPKKPKVQQRDDINASPENFSTDSLRSNVDQKSVELDKKKA